MISIDRNTGKVLCSTEIKPENIQKSLEKILVVHTELHPEILENLSCKAQV